MGKTAVLVLGHGSKAKEANEAMYQVIEELKTKFAFPIVEAAFLEINNPTIEEGFDTCVASGASKVIVVPYFLHLGMHVQYDLPEILQRCQNKYPGVQMNMGKHIGYDPKITQILLERIKSAEENV